MTYSTGEPWRGSLNQDHSAPGPHSRAQPPRVRRRISSTTLIGSGVAVALALGVGLGLLARPDIGTQGAPTAMHAATSASDQAASAGRMNIELSSPPARPIVPSAGKLEVLPPETARTAATLPPPPAAPPAQAAPQPPLKLTQPAPPAAALTLAPARPAPIQDGSRDQGCEFGSFAAQMVCADPQLTAADREMARAYRRALQIGAPPEQLRADQRDWLAAREEAARRSRGAVASVYDQRIEELNQLIDDGPG